MNILCFFDALIIFNRDKAKPKKLHTYIQTNKQTYIHTYIHNFTEVQVSRVITVLLLQNCFVWYKDHTHQAIEIKIKIELKLPDECGPCTIGNSPAVYEYIFNYELN